jgi:dihydroorotate dehydrogenase
VIDLAYRLVQPVLFRRDPEAVHNRVISTLAAISKYPLATALLAARRPHTDPRLAVEIAGLALPGPVGIAAGLDKNGVAYPALHALGWDFVEVGTITPEPQPGNPQPRVFRLPEDSALINRMGFPSAGANAVAGNLARRSFANVPIGCNVGPNKSSVEAGLQAVIADLTGLVARFAPAADYLVINISSPNTARLRELQGKVALQTLLTEVAAANPPDSQRPLFVKIAPDLSDREIADVVEVVQRTGLSGIVATNTSTIRPPSLRSALSIESGGLSGSPLLARAQEVVSRIAQQSGGEVPVIAVGGIASGRDALSMIRAGASAIQIYTASLYRGPGLANQIKRELLSELDRFSAASLDELRRSAM